MRLFVLNTVEWQLARTWYCRLTFPLAFYTLHNYIVEWNIVMDASLKVTYSSLFTHINFSFFKSLKFNKSTRLFLSIHSDIVLLVMKFIPMKLIFSPSFIIGKLSATSLQWIFFFLESHNYPYLGSPCFHIYHFSSITKNLWYIFFAFNVIYWSFSQC